MILVVGGTGRIGKQLVRVLAERQVPFQVLCRKPEQSRIVFPKDVRLVRGYLEDFSGLLKTLEGIDVVFLLSSENPHQVDLQSNFIRAARQSGVRYVVKVSMLGAAEHSHAQVARMHWQTEQELAQSGMEWTVLRPGIISQNHLLYADSIRLESKVRAPAGNGKAAAIDARDVADAAAEILTGEGHAGQTYDLTGPEELSYADTARLISVAIDSRVNYHNISVEDARENMRKTRVPTWLVEYRLDRYRIWSNNEASLVTPSLGNLTGKPPRSFLQFIRDHASAFRAHGRTHHGRG